MLKAKISLWKGYYMWGMAWKYNGLRKGLPGMHQHYFFCWLQNCSLPQLLWDLLSGRSKIIGWYLTTLLAVICISQVLNILISGGWIEGSLGKSVRLFFTDSYFFSKHLLLVIHRQCWSGLKLWKIWFSSAYALFWEK